MHGVRHAQADRSVALRAGSVSVAEWKGATPAISRLDFVGRGNPPRKINL